jgi:hypothetical protein
MTVYCDVVLKVTVTLVEGDCGTTVPEVDSAQFAATAPPRLQLSVRGNANPAIGAMDAVVVTESPAITLPDVGAKAMAKSTPFPVMVAVSPSYSRLVEFTESVPG